MYITIEEWQALKSKYTDLQKEEAENTVELANWQKNIVEDRLNEYYKHPNSIDDFDKTIDDIEKGL